VAHVTPSILRDDDAVDDDSDVGQADDLKNLFILFKNSLCCRW
jgi:hypothetical protein